MEEKTDPYLENLIAKKLRCRGVLVTKEHLENCSRMLIKAGYPHNITQTEIKDTFDNYSDATKLRRREIKHAGGPKTFMKQMYG